MVAIKPSGSSKFGEYVKEKVKKIKRNKTGIASSFTPGLLKSNTRDVSARERLLQLYLATLKHCHFNNVEVKSRKHVPSIWRISLSPSSSYEVELALDRDMNLLTVAERSVNWVHGTIISGDKQTFSDNILQNPDIRLKICTTDTVKEESDLYHAVLPMVNGRIVLPIEQKDGKPILSAVYSRQKKLTNIVCMVRHIQTLEMYSDGFVDASIAYGDCYFGEKLVLSRPFCELSLYFNSEKLQDALSNYNDHEKIEEFAKEFFNKALYVGECLENQIQSSRV